MIDSQGIWIIYVSMWSLVHLVLNRYLSQYEILKLIIKGFVGFNHYILGAAEAIKMWVCSLLGLFLGKYHKLMMMILTPMTVLSSAIVTCLALSTAVATCC